MSNELAFFLKEQGIGNLSKLNNYTTISENLGIDGDDALEFLTTFSDKFEVDMSKFPYDDYFCAEGYGFWMFLLFLIGRKRKYKKLTLGDLDFAIQTKILK